MIASPYVAYERAVRDSGGVDFDDLVVRALDRLTSDERLLASWRARTSTLLVDEAQDLDRTQLDLALVLAGPGRNLCAVGDDDHSLSEFPAAPASGPQAATAGTNVTPPSLTYVR